MPTIEFDDQFVLEPAAPVRERYDTAAILRRNVANLEIALTQQTERAEAAEAELAKLALQKPFGRFVKIIDPIDKNSHTYGVAYYSGFYVADLLDKGVYAAPVAPPAVPDEWREVMAELTADVQAACDAEHPHRDQYPSVMRKYKNDMEIVEKARSLLQSAEVKK